MMTAHDPEERRRDYEERERRRIVGEGQRGMRSDDETRAEELLEWERRDREAGRERRLENIEKRLADTREDIADLKQSVAGVIPGVERVVSDVVNGKLKKLREDVDELKDKEPGNRVVRTWFAALLVSLGVATGTVIVTYFTGHLQRFFEWHTVSSAPVNPQPSVLFKGSPLPEDPYLVCRQHVRSLGLSEATESRVTIERCGQLRKRDLP